MNKAGGDEPRHYVDLEISVHALSLIEAAEVDSAGWAGGPALFNQLFETY